MQSLAYFDHCFRRHAGAALPQLRDQGAGVRPEKLPPPAQVALAAPHLISPWGEAVAPMPRRASAARILRAAHAVRDGDWLALLADETQARGSQQAWRLALWRSKGAPQHSQAPQWLSPALVARPGLSPRSLRDAVLRLAVQALWQQGWRLQEAFSPDWH